MSDRAAAEKLVLGVATETGNSTMVAKKFAQAVSALGFDVEPQYLNDLTPDDLAGATHFLVITATYGDGEVPYDAEVFWESLSSEDADRLDHLTFAVLGLGDSFYPLFCNAGKVIDARLEELGARRLIDRVDCDLEFEEPADAWTADVINLLSELTPRNPRRSIPRPSAGNSIHRGIGRIRSQRDWWAIGS